ncbi:MAG: septin-like protein [Monoraphidium minutum]|nr:MAG: septin-like protein [Monoraphidium minutum]
MAESLYSSRDGRMEQRHSQGPLEAAYYASGEQGRRHDGPALTSGSAPGRVFDAAARASQAALLGPRRPRPHKIWRKKFIKVLIVGDSGLGKTTLVKTLLSTPGERLQVHDGTFTPSSQFVKDPDSLCSTVTWKDEEDRVIWVYRIQDTPGYGDDLDIMNHIRMIRSYIDSQNTKWLDIESARDRTIDLSEVEDPRVDVCLFCLPPHRLRAIDLRYMFELGRSVPIVPVITKADTMTIREAQNYKQEVFNRLQNPNIPGVRGKINTFSFDKDTLERAGMGEAAGTQAPPFLVIASNDINDEMNAMEVPVFWPERRYPWGTAEAFNPDHSDLLFLRALLLKEALEDVCKDKRARYEVWRRRALGGVKVGRRLRAFVATTVVPVALALWFAQNGFDVQKSKEQLRSATRRARSRVGGAIGGGGGKGGGGAAEAAAAPPAPPVPPPAPKKKGWFS